MSRLRRKVFYGWWLVLASFIMFAVGGGLCSYGFSTFFNPIIDEFGWTRAQISLAFSLRSLEWGLLAPAIGFFIDRFGGRRLVIFGAVLLGASFLMMSRTTSLAFFYGSFLLMALAQGCALGSAQFVAVANWFSRKRTRAMGIISAGFGVSGVMGPVLVWLISQYGWRDTLVISGILLWVLGIPLALVIRDRPEPYGYAPDGETLSPSHRAGATSNSESVINDDVARQQSKGLSVREALKTRTFWLLVIFSCLGGFSMSSINVHVVPFLTSVGISRQLAGLTILGITSSSLIGRLGFAWVGDFYDKRYLLAIGRALQFLGVLIFSQISSPQLLIPFLLTYGIGFGGVIPIYAAFTADYFGLKSYATIRGLLALGWTISGLLGPLLAGWVFDVSGSYRPAFIAFAVMTALAIPIPLFIKLQRG